MCIRDRISIEGFDDVCSLIVKAAKGGALLRDDGLPRAMGDLILGAGGEYGVIDHGERLAPCALRARVFKPRCLRISGGDAIVHGVTVPSEGSVSVIGRFAVARRK